MKQLIACLTLALTLSACDDGDSSGGSTLKPGQYPDKHACSIDFDCAYGLACSSLDRCAPIPCRLDDSECPKSATGWERSCVERLCRNECATDQQCADFKPPTNKCVNRVCIVDPTKTQDASSADGAASD